MAPYCWRLLILLTLLFSVGSCPSIAQDEPTDCSAIRYEHLNQIDPKPIKLSTVRGIAIDETGKPVWKGCVGVFSEDHSRLVASASIQADGSFSFPKLPAGNYVLIVTSLGFCPANNAVRMRHGRHRKQELIATMKLHGIDTCSWIEVK
jgi:hypothetical protein